jgi:hypothetical protein
LLVDFLKKLASLKEAEKTYLAEKGTDLVLIEKEFCEAIEVIILKLSIIKEEGTEGMAKATMRILLDEPLKQIIESLNGSIANIQKLKEEDPDAFKGML